MRSLLHKAAFAAALLLSLAGCAQRARLIPERAMVKLYVDMFLADQWAREHRELRSYFDTTLFFDPILARHGYTFEDYDYSIGYYASKPEQISDIATEVSKFLSAESERLKALEELDRKNKDINASNRRLYLLQDFSTDSLRLSQIDSAWHKQPKDSLPIGFLKPIVIKERTELRKAFKDTLLLEKELIPFEEPADPDVQRLKTIEKNIQTKVKSIIQ